MTRLIPNSAVAILAIVVPCLLSPAWATVWADVRIKDITDVEGIRENQLIGYGLVVGLNGTGDKLNNNVFTRESLIGMLERLRGNNRGQGAHWYTRKLSAH